MRQSLLILVLLTSCSRNEKRFEVTYFEAPWTEVSQVPNFDGAWNIDGQNWAISSGTAATDSKTYKVTSDAPCEVVLKKYDHPSLRMTYTPGNPPILRGTSAVGIVMEHGIVVCALGNYFLIRKGFCTRFHRDLMHKETWHRHPVDCVVSEEQISISASENLKLSKVGQFYLTTTQ